VAGASTVEGTAGAAPEPAGCAGGHVDCPRLSWVQLRASTDRDGCWPHCGTAVVSNSEGGRAGTGSKGSQEEEED
jgi:hypothetical protein